MSKKNKAIFYVNFYIWFTLTFCPFLDDKFNYSLDNDPFFFVYVSLFCTYFNLWNSKRCGDRKIINAFDFSFIRISNLTRIFNLIKLDLKKFTFFSTNVTFLKLIKIISQIFKSFADKLVFWNPLFKKTSYFSYYRSNSSRFFK